MNTTEAKFILQARRPNGSDDGDVRFVEALAQARQDPALADWLAKEQAFDTTIAVKLRSIQPPAGLRESILLGARESRPLPFWRRPAVFGLAASVAIILGLLTVVKFQPTVGREQLALGVMAEVDSAEHHEVMPMAQGALRTALTDPAMRLAAGLDLDFADLKRDGCRSLKIADRDVLEVCFERGGWFHLYVARREDFGGKPGNTQPIFREQGTSASVAWTDARHSYVLVTSEGAAALRNIF